MGVKISPELRQQVLVPQRVQAATAVTHGDAFKVYTQTTGGSITFTLPSARAGDGPFYFNVANAASVIVVAPQAADAIGGNALNTSITLPAQAGWFIGFYCNTAGTWSPMQAGAGLVVPAVLTAPSGVVALTINTAGSTDGLQIFGPIGQGASLTLAGNGVTAANGFQLQYSSGGNANLSLGGGIRIRITGGSGAVTIFAPTSAVNALTVNAFAGTATIVATAGAVGDHAIVINGQAAGRSTLQWSVSGPAFAFTGINNAAGDLIAGTNAQTFCMRMQAVDWAVSVNSGANAALTIFTATNNATFRGSIGINNVTAPAQVTGFGTPVGNAVVASYNITDAGGANSNTNKCVAEMLVVLKAYGLIGA